MSPAEQEPRELELSDEDILDALSHIPGYIDISTEDFRTIYHLAWRHAVERLRGQPNSGTADGDTQ
jgi:CBS-domain-containing membrane protein